jgi:hypothetical protein
MKERQREPSSMQSSNAAEAHHNSDVGVVRMSMLHICSFCAETARHGCSTTRPYYGSVLAPAHAGWTIRSAADAVV